MNDRSAISRHEPAETLRHARQREAHMFQRQLGGRLRDACGVAELDDVHDDFLGLLAKADKAQ